MMLELNYIVLPNNIEIGGGGLSQIFCGRLSENWGKSSTGFGILLYNIFIASAYVNVYKQNLHNIFGSQWKTCRYTSIILCDSLPKLS